MIKGQVARITWSHVRVVKLQHMALPRKQGFIVLLLGVHAAHKVLQLKQTDLKPHRSNVHTSNKYNTVRLAALHLR